MKKVMFRFLPTGDYITNKHVAFSEIVDMDDESNSIITTFKNRFGDVDNFTFHTIDSDSCNRYVISVTFDITFTDYDGNKSIKSDSWDVYFTRTSACIKPTLNFEEHCPMFGVCDKRETIVSGLLPNDCPLRKVEDKQ